MSDKLKNSDLISGHPFSFDSGIAMHCGVNAALVYHHICFWIKQNAQREDCWHQGKSWMYQSQEQIAKHFEFISRDQVQKCIKILTDKGLLIKENFNHTEMDKTTWYSVPDEIFKKLVTIVQNRTIDCVNPHNGKRKSAQCIYSNTIKKNINERSADEKQQPCDEKSEEKPKENVQRKGTKFSNREVPEFLKSLSKIPDKDKQILANQFTDSELIRGLEDASSYHMKKNKLVNIAAFVTQRCKSYREKRTQ